MGASFKFTQAWATLAFALPLAAATVGHAQPDRTKTFDEIIADCDPKTGFPFSVSPQAPPGTHVVINPDWLTRPSVKEIEKAYPAEARKSRVTGHAAVQCVVGADGWTHDCVVKEETPDGHGFGAAALSLMPKMRFIPRRRDCVPVDGAKVTVPYSFNW